MGKGKIIQPQKAFQCLGQSKWVISCIYLAISSSPINLRSLPPSITASAKASCSPVKTALLSGAINKCLTPASTDNHITEFPVEDFILPLRRSGKKVHFVEGLFTILDFGTHETIQ